MDLNKVSNETKLKLCRWYYLAPWRWMKRTKCGGFCLLPFLWLINAVWFFSEAFKKPPYDEQKQIKTYVVRSAIGAIIWSSVLITWIAIFQTNRADWGEIADRMSFIIPTGIP